MLVTARIDTAVAAIQANRFQIAQELLTDVSNGSTEGTGLALLIG